MAVKILVDEVFRDIILASEEAPETCVDDHGDVFRRFRCPSSGDWKWINVKNGGVLGPRLYDARPCDLEIKVK